MAATVATAKALLGAYFAFPAALAALLLLPLLLLVSRRPWLRMGALAALIVALAQPYAPIGDGNLALVVDVSDSVGERALGAAKELDLSSLAREPEVVLAAADAIRSGGLPAAPPAGLATDATDLSRALQVAAANGAQRILLVSDGITDERALLTTLPPVPVDVLHVPTTGGARLSELLLPAEASPGQAVEGVLIVRGGEGQRAEVHLELSGEPDRVLDVELSSGETAVPFAFMAPRGADATTRVRATLVRESGEPGGEPLTGELSVRADPPVLVIGDPALTELLRVQGVDVVAGEPRMVHAPLPYSAVILRGSSAEFTQGQLDLLKEFVESGGGLLMSGGPDSFGFGGWYRTAVEDVLPVTTDLRTDVTLPLVAMVLVIDVSQSMSTGRPPRIELAKEGALKVVELAYQEDLLGLVAFSDGAGTRWVFEPRQATERGKREMAQSILALRTGGGTILEPAYRMALEALHETPAALKHVIVLSDGQLYDGISPFGGQSGSPVDFGAIAREALARGVTTSTIAIGESADFRRLSEIARAGGGRYYAALDVGTLPKIFTDEALAATRALLVDEPTAPTPRQNPLYSFPGELPVVDAYVATSLKSGAQELLTGREGEPLLATMRAGLGRTAALTTDLNAWAGEFGDWDELPGAVATIVRWLKARPPGFTATAERSGSGVLVTLDAVEDGAYVNNARIDARLGGVSARLEQVAPGRYEGHLPYGGGGGSVILASEGEVVARARITGPDPEFAELDGAAILSRVASVSGGRVVSPESAYAPPLGASKRHLWQFFALFAAALFLLELVVRRVAGYGSP